MAVSEWLCPNGLVHAPARMHTLDCRPHATRRRQVRSAFSQARESLRRMGRLAGVPIEPSEQTRLADASMQVPGVLVSIAAFTLACILHSHGASCRDRSAQKPLSVLCTALNLTPSAASTPRDPFHATLAPRLQVCRVQVVSTRYVQSPPQPQVKMGCMHCGAGPGARALAQWTSGRTRMPGCACEPACRRGCGLVCHVGI